MKPPVPRPGSARLPWVIAAAVGVVGLVGLIGGQLPAHGQDEPRPGAAMQAAARELLDMPLPPEVSNFQGAWDDPERLDWAYVPVSRTGLPLLFLDEQGREKVWGLVSTGLGERGMGQARDIVSLESILYERSGRDDRRDPGRYFVTIFGVPGRFGNWGWRFEGHHLSLNFTLRDGKVLSTTPAFFGGNPAHVQEGEHTGLRPFAAEEDRARELVRSLPEPLRRQAIYSAEAPADILTSDDVPAARPPLLGVRVGDLGPEARADMETLLALYAARLDPELAAAELARIEADGMGELRLAWAGSLEPGQPHYYRIQGPSFVIEYDNTQDGANHVHTVWRDFERDFGNDPLRAHLADHHGPDGHSH